ncbi:DUF4145 domain-containing protein [Aeromonas salmonicida]|jgi:hypothetical protein|uniref:DUF4145 domain-containing protein n=1 Tax=Aeromonas salmonicida TaxID=645 RepID=UPI0038BCB4C9
MICPHCQTSIHSHETRSNIGQYGQKDEEAYYWSYSIQTCPECNNPIIFLSYVLMSPQHVPGETRKYLVFPRNSGRPSAPTEVPETISTDYNEACSVLSLSAQASAALSRRCLQHLLANTGLSKNSNLDRAIEEAKAKGLPSYIADQLDAMRVIGNFAAHTQKSVNTGEILPVEPHEAEWNLDVLDMLFDFCYVQPAKTAARRATLDAKLAEAGKPSLK